MIVLKKEKGRFPVPLADFGTAATQAWSGTGPTKRTLAAGDATVFSSIFLASSFFCFQPEATPAQHL